MIKHGYKIVKKTGYGLMSAIINGPGCVIYTPGAVPAKRILVIKLIEEVTI